jgi:hypothetical protein
MEYSVFKGTGSVDRLELSRHFLVHPGLEKGRGRFLNVSDVPLQKKIFLLLASPLRRVFGQNSLASCWSKQLALSSHWLKKFANSTLAYLIIDQNHAVWD